MNRAASNEAILKKPLKSSKIKSRVFFKFVHDLKINPFFQPRYLIGSFVFNKCTQCEVTNPAMFAVKMY